MNTVIVPFHDWRKIIVEGFRTRDAHFIEEFGKDKEKITLVVNRPTTLLEIILKRKPRELKYEVVLKKGPFRLYRIKPNLYVVDFISLNVISQISTKHLWFVQQYGNKRYIDFIHEALQILQIKNNYALLNQNIFAFKLTQALKPKCSIFDAWDNFLKFKVYKDVKSTIEKGYTVYGKVCDFWITNSVDNINSFKEPFGPKEIHLINNGVDIERFVENSDFKTPKDLENIPRPIVGFGGKITQLIDVGLINKTMELSTSSSFVFIGQILDKEVFKAIKKLGNFYFLGDKHYEDYPRYVKNFDICIVPYVTDEEKKSGANSIKVYEYLAANKKVVGTNSNGLENLNDYVYIVNSAEEFSNEIRKTENNKQKLNVEFHSWQYKLMTLNKIINAYN